MNKFLIIRFSSIGDIVLTTPVIRCLRKHYPDSEIHYATKRSFAMILEHNPHINKLHLLDDNIDEMIMKLRAENFDHIIDLHNNIRTSRIKKALKKIPSSTLNKLNIRKWLFTALKINTLPDRHIVDRYMDTVRILRIMNDGLGLDYFIPEKDIVKENDLPLSHLAGFIAIVIGAAHNTKKLPVEKLKQLCLQIDHPIILIGGKEDIDAGLQIASADTIKVYNACGKFNLNESADLVRRAKLVISHDTGMIHIAAAFRKNIISVWGNTVPSFGMTPYNTFYEKFEVKKLWCRPCSKIGYDSCPLGHFKCMNKQPIEEMVLRIKGILK